MIIYFKFLFFFALPLESSFAVEIIRNYNK